MEGRRWKEGSREIEEEREGRLYNEDTHGDNEGVHNGGIYTTVHTDSHVDDEGVRDGSQDGLLTVDVLHLSLLNHLCNGYNLESVELPRGDVMSQHHTTKCACA